MMNEANIPWDAIAAIVIAIVFVVGYSLFCWSRVKLQKFDRAIPSKKATNDLVRVAQDQIEEQQKWEEFRNTFDLRM